ncbi:CDP-diacylglycerol--serine O-phosphatidyltransferase [Silvanigrella paludirubra]|uniref:CDP-diacylglycerol--serine O-phosphatidyltransferase n=1 Tax=Silvanigrella paludirubra TaxID=2499159 RepID=A0A6N6VZW0_9BACT|nr:CDP-diacylglycerol--serine O-phosphatidyltransferase [Silvanigrella paludirubra]KAB8040388.1 CDP-diacylglycerol--serine O-phosphatidyltransferase [Silvanigrella paludirubra]
MNPELHENLNNKENNVSHLIDKKRKVKSSIYLLPNLITSASLFFGLLAIKYSIDGRMNGNMQEFVFAAYAILAAGLCDGLDGSVARLTHTQSSFGVQLDSLCDLVSFGIAPAIVIYNYALNDFFRLGFCVAFIFAACGALRLARFNVQSEMGKTSGNFTGLPIPMAAAPLAVFIMAQNELASWTLADHSKWEVLLAQTLTIPEVRNITLLIIMFLLALGMVSTFEYLSHKSMRLPRKRPFRVLSAVLIICAIIFILQFVVSLALFLIIYCFHGPVLWIFTRKDKAEEEEELFEAGNNSE